MTAQNPDCLGGLFTLFVPTRRKKSAVQNQPGSENIFDTPFFVAPEIYSYRMRDDFLSTTKASVFG